ncbi:TIGR00282 family metallophosphoesterase [Mycoplasmopsis gallinarum]|uniref:TIGR00282 family metallophosphoesterase n=1 Tax=Mycoplasmopsis gallinarum TaxID=29557 RepID=UPI000484EC26|nr:TIGR00282 family metallophosphoesterase [Mycoplasmopsis gallinarum]
MKNKKLTILFIGDIFGAPGIEIVQQTLPKLKNKYKIDFVIAQGENVSGRKGLNKNDYLTLKEAGVDFFTMGNHVWANSEILSFINNGDLVRPANVSNSYPGFGTKIVNLKNKTLRITSLMGLSFNPLLSPWKENQANNFFDKIDSILNNEEKADFHFVDFHAETTSEKYVLGLYLDGKVDGFAGTHTHVQTNDAHVLPLGTCYITDAGMCGPIDSAIGANFNDVYQKMRFGANVRFTVSKNRSQFNAVLMKFNTINKQNNSIKAINIK